MNELNAGRAPIRADEDISVLSLATLLLRHRRSIIVMATLGALLGLGSGYFFSRYTSSATFIPRAQDEGANSALAMAASQFGIRVPSANQGWGPPIYVELLGSDELLGTIAMDTLTVAEMGGARVPTMDLLKISGSTPNKRLHRAVLALRKKIGASEDKKLGAVRVAVTTKWPSVSRALVLRLLQLVNEFNMSKRKSQAAAERQFVEAQAGRAEQALHEAEDRLEAFLKQNRGSLASSPDLGLQRDRLQREVTLRQQVYTTLVQSREEARIREVRDTPVFTILQEPQLPVAGEDLGLGKKTVVGAFAGGMLALVFAFLMSTMRGAAKLPDSEATEFLRLIEEVKPGFLRRQAR